MTNSKRRDIVSISGWCFYTPTIVILSFPRQFLELLMRSDFFPTYLRHVKWNSSVERGLTSRSTEIPLHSMETLATWGLTLSRIFVTYLWAIRKLFSISPNRTRSSKYAGAYFSAGPSFTRRRPSEPVKHKRNSSENSTLLQSSSYQMI